MKKPRRELLPGCIFGYYLATTTTENCCTSLNDTKSKMTLYRLIQDAAKRDKMDKPQLITRRSLVQIRPPQPPSVLRYLRTLFVVCIRYEEGAAAHRFSRKCSSPSYCIKNLHLLAVEMVAAHKARQMEGLAGGCARSMMAAKSYCAAVLLLYLPFTTCRPPRHGRARREQGSLVSGSRAGCRPGG